MIWKLSQSDPMLNRWAEQVNDRNSRRDRRVFPTPVEGARAASSSPGTTSLAQVDVIEIYSPPRVTIVAKESGLKAGSAMDLRTGYDFSTQRDQERARQQLRKRET